MVRGGRRSRSWQRRAAASGPARQGCGHHSRRGRTAPRCREHHRAGAGARGRRRTQHRQLRARLREHDLERLPRGSWRRTGEPQTRAGQPRGALLVQRQRREPLVPDTRLHDRDHDTARHAAHLARDRARARARHAGSALRDSAHPRADPDRKDVAVFPPRHGVDGGVRADRAVAVPVAAARLVPDSRPRVGGVPGAGAGAGAADIRHHAHADGGGAARAHDRLHAGDDAVGVSVRHPLDAPVATGHHACDPGALHERLAADGVPRGRCVGGARAQHAVHAGRRRAVLRPHLAAAAQAVGLKGACAVLHRLLAIVRKVLITMLRDPRARRALILPPIIQLFIFSSAATMEVKNIALAIVDLDRGPYAADVEQRLSGSRSFTRLPRYANVAGARVALEREQVIGILVLPSGFSPDLAAGRPASAQLLLDGRRSNAAQITAQYVSTILAAEAAPLSGAPPQARPAGGAGPAPPPNAQVVIDNWFNPNLEYQWFMLPNLVGMLSLGVALMITALSVARERELGTFDQTLVSPATPVEIALGKLLPPLLVASVQATLYLLIVTLLYGVPFRGNLLVFSTAVLTFAAACAGVGLFISSLVRTQQQAFLGAFAVLLPFALLSGFATPIENMPWWLQFLTTINPLAHMLRLMQGLFLKGASVASLAQDLLRLLEIALCTTAAAVLLFRRKAA